MKKFRFFAVLLCLAVTLTALSAPATASPLYSLPEDMTLSAQAALVVNLGTTAEQDTILFEKEADTMRSPAALVRLMAGAYAATIIREKGLDVDAVQGTYTNACYELIGGTGLATAIMDIGETWTLRDLLTMTMIQTAADAAVTLAVTLSGSHQQFVNGMNELAKEIGCEKTSFANIHGLEAANQYTTARDLYRIFRYTMDFPEIRDMMSTAEYTVHPVSGQAPSTWVNSNEMLRSSTSSYYSPVKFGRTGYTDEAGRCVVSLAADSGYEYVVVVLGCPDTDAQGNSGVQFADSKALFRWAFRNFTYRTIISRNTPVDRLPVNLAWDTDTVTLVPKEDFAMVVANDLDPSAIRKVITREESVDAPIEKDKVYGKVELFINLDQKLGEVELVASESIERSQALAVWRSVKNFLLSPWFYVALGGVLLLLLAYIILTIVHNRKRKRRRMKRVKRYR